MAVEAPLSDCFHEHDRPDFSASAPEVVDRAAAMLRAMGEPSRLALLERLAAGEACVSQLAEEAGVGISTVSHRLRVLHKQGLLQRRREDRHIFYSLADGHVADLVRTVLEHSDEGPV